MALIDYWAAFKRGMKTEHEHMRIEQADYDSATRPAYESEAITDLLELHHPERMKQIHRDYKWLQNQCKLYGFEPADARWML